MATKKKFSASLILPMISQIPVSTLLDQMSEEVLTKILENKSYFSFALGRRQFLPGYSSYSDTISWAFRAGTNAVTEAKCDNVFIIELNDVAYFIADPEGISSTEQLKKILTA